jgi:hypothetical protein
MRTLSALSGAGSTAFIVLEQQTGVTGYIYMGLVAGIVTLTLSFYTDMGEVK